VSRAVAIVIAIFVVGLILLACYLARLLRKSREVAKRIDYSKMQEWDDEDW
jgi:hypothetical protein